MLSGSSSSSPDQQSAQQQQQPDQTKPGHPHQQAQQPTAPAQQPLQHQRHAFGMLLFSCNGRGTSLYNEPSWDSRTLAAYIPVPVSGFMCNGEWLLAHIVPVRQSRVSAHAIAPMLVFCHCLLFGLILW